jgi:hypothetical protein
VQNIGKNAAQVDVPLAFKKLFNPPLSGSLFENRRKRPRKHQPPYGTQLIINAK